MASVWQAITSDSTHTSLSSGGAGDAVGTGSPAANSIWVGTRSDDAAYLNGFMDEVRVWNTQRTQAELDANFKTTLCGTEAGLVHYYKFNNDYVDAGSGKNNLTAVNSPTLSATVPQAGTDAVCAKKVIIFEQ